MLPDFPWVLELNSLLSALYEVGTVCGWLRAVFVSVRQRGVCTKNRWLDLPGCTGQRTAAGTLAHPPNGTFFDHVSWTYARAQTLHAPLPKWRGRGTHLVFPVRCVS